MASTPNLHGKIDFRWEQNLLVMNCVGPFNLESLQHHFKLIKSSVAEKKYQHWKRLEIVDQDTLAPPEGMKFAGEYFAWAAENGCQKAAFLTQSKVISEFLSDFKELNIKVFSDEREAWNWLASDV